MKRVGNKCALKENEKHDQKAMYQMKLKGFV